MSRRPYSGLSRRDRALTAADNVERSQDMQAAALATDACSSCDHPRELHAAGCSGDSWNPTTRAFEACACGGFES